MTPKDTTPGHITPAAHSMTQHKPLHFPTQRPNEHVVLLLRRHWTVLARDVSQLVISLIIPPIVLLLLFFYTSFTLVPGTALYVVIVMVLSLYYLFSFLAFFHDFVDYHLDIWVVTDQRVVSIEQSGLFNRVVSELSIVRIQDVTSEIKGKVQTFLDYGQVHIQSAGEQARFVFEQVPHPAEVAKVILQAHERALQQSEMQQIRQSEAYRHEMNRTDGGVGPRPQPQPRPVTSPILRDPTSGLPPSTPASEPRPMHTRNVPPRHQSDGSFGDVPPAPPI